MESPTGTSPSLSSNPSQTHPMSSSSYASGHQANGYPHDNHYNHPPPFHHHHMYPGGHHHHHQQPGPGVHYGRRGSYGAAGYMHEASSPGMPSTPMMTPGMPYIPIDMHYGHSMLPSNLLVNSPCFTPNMSALSLYQMGPTPGYPHQNVSSPYLTSAKLDDNPYDQLNVSRTIILKHLNKDLTLNSLLNHIDVGPIEYVRFFSKPAPKQFAQDETFNYCYISFINSKVSINFHLKYCANQSNFNDFKKVLNSDNLKISFNDSNVLNGQGTSSNKQDYIKLKTLNYILEFNATRAVTVKLHLNKSIVDEGLESFKTIMSKFGDHEDFKYDVQDNVLTITVHFNSIDSAVKTYEYTLRRIQTDKQESIENDLGTDDHLRFISVDFGKDRCDNTPLEKSLKPKRKSNPRISPTTEKCNDIEESPYSDDEQEASLSPKINPEIVLEKNESIRNTIFVEKDPYISNSEDNLSSDSPNYDENYSVVSSNKYYYPPSYPVPQNVGYQNPDPYNMGNRTIYLGNLHPNTTVEEIANNVRAGGLVESIKFHPDKRNCFITFVDPNVALKFHLNHQVLHQLIIHGYDINVGWAKTHSGPLNREIALAVTAGASRNVYIGIKLVKDSSGEEVENQQKPSLPSESELRSDFSKFGELEQINFYHNNDCGFLNFCNIIDAIRLVELFEFKSIEKVAKIFGDEGEFYQKYQNFKISFAKDRCGNPPKFSFKKNFGRVRKKIYFNNFYEPESGSERRGSERGVEEAADEDPITDEAAMVFGIIKNKDDVEEKNPSPTASDEENDDNDEETISESVSELQLEGNEKSDDILHHKTNQNTLQKVDENDVVDGDDEEDEEDDDRSVLLGSDDTSSTTANNSNGNINKDRKHKFFSNIVNSSDSFIPLRKGSKNQSNVSLSSQSSKHKYSQHHSMSPYAHAGAYYGGPNYSMSMPQTPKMGYHMMPPPPPPMPYYGRSNSMYGYYPMMTPTVPSTPVMAGPYLESAPSRATPFSGSQVMAQYLAKSQTDSMMYQPPVVYDVDNGFEYRAKKNSKKD